MEGFLLSFVVIFVAELGDKSQLMAMTFATRYRFWTVIGGITIATAVVHLGSVALGGFLGSNLPTGFINVLAGVAFIGFGLWTLRGDELSESEEARTKRTAWSSIVVVTVAFFLAELGDKTMLATVTLATQHSFLGTWIGSTLGMVAADALAVGLGVWLGRALPAKFIKIAAAVLFFLFGALLILQGIVWS